MQSLYEYTKIRENIWQIAEDDGYLVINSHGHPDHIGGNHWFEEIRAAKEEWDVLSLGNLHFEIISLKGHTKDSIGVLVQEGASLLQGMG